MQIDRVIHIVDADPVALVHGALILEAADYTVVRHASGDSFLDSPLDARPGCVLLDIGLPQPDGLAVQDRMMKAGIAMPVIVFTGQDALDIAVRAMKAGALHFLEKPYVDEDLLVIVAEALDRLDAKEDSENRKTRAISLLALLSPRERQVMQGLMEGRFSKVIAHDLGLSVRTVEMYRTKLMDKLGVRTLSGVFRLCFDAER